MNASLVILALTVASFLLGFLRDLFIAKSFGLSWEADLIFVALILPMFFENLALLAGHAHGRSCECRRHHWKLLDSEHAGARLDGRSGCRRPDRILRRRGTGRRSGGFVLPGCTAEHG